MVDTVVSACGVMNTFTHLIGAEQHCGLADRAKECFSSKQPSDVVPDSEEDWTAATATAAAGGVASGDSQAGKCRNRLSILLFGFDFIQQILFVHPAPCSRCTLV